MQREPGQLFFITTQGCKVNQYESQAIREAWTADGLMETHDPALADIVLINSCAVTERAILDLGKLVRGYCQYAPRPHIVVAGCAVNADRDRIAAIPGVDAIFSQKEKAGLARLENNNSFPALSIHDYTRARAVLKIQDGCSHGCTYCIIPSTRGKAVSRDPEDALREAKRLFAAGIPELSLCGINVRQFGRDLNPPIDFWDLLARLDSTLAPSWSKQARIRLSSLEPADLHQKALDTLKNCVMVCPHLHLSLQSGSTRILRRMGRGHYTADDVFRFLDGLTPIWTLYGLGADIITGFPGETEALFAETVAVVERLPLTYAHIFPYSERPGTAAVNFPGSVPPHIRKERAKTLRRIVAEKRQTFLARLLQQQHMELILEDGTHGVNEFYVDCHLDENTASARQKLLVRPLRLEKDMLITQAVAQTTHSR